jgi:23S rRNA pseudouridine2457 synthase
MHKYYIIYKPVPMLSQFIGTENRCLKHLDYNFPEGIHAIGRLDNLSEGLLLLTTNKKIHRLLFLSKQPHKRTYLVRVQFEVKPATLDKLRKGIAIQIHEGATYITAPCEVDTIERPQNISEGRYDDMNHLPHTWLRMTITEGKYHQVRKMVLAAGHKCQRLIRHSIEDLSYGDLKPGEVQEINEEDFFRLLKIEQVKS